MILWNATDFILTSLGESISDSDTEFDVAAGGGAMFPTLATGEWVDAYIVTCSDPTRMTLAQQMSGDLVHVTGVSSNTLTVTRTASARAHTSGELVLGNLSAVMLNRLVDKVMDLEAVLARSLGGDDRVIGYGAGAGAAVLEVVPSTPAAMTVLVKAGAAVVDFQFVWLREDTTSGTITAPVSQPRTDVVEANIGVGGNLDGINIVTGVEGGGVPATSSNAIKLAEIALTTGTTTITVSEITDSRSW